MDFSGILWRLFSCWSVGFFVAPLLIAPLSVVGVFLKIARDASSDIRGSFS